MKQAINAYHSITASDEFRERERLWSKARHDEATALHNAKLEGRLEGKLEGRLEGRLEGKLDGIKSIARNALRMNMSFDDISKMTGLTRDEIEKLENAE